MAKWIKTNHVFYPIARTPLVQSELYWLRKTTESNGRLEMKTAYENLRLEAIARWELSNRDPDHLDLLMFVCRLAGGVLDQKQPIKSSWQIIKGY